LKHPVIQRKGKERQGKARKGENVLITGVGGGTGVIALQMAVAAGCQVFVTSGSNAKIDKTKHLGVRDGVNYKTPDWSKQLGQLAGGFDLIIDSSLGDGFPKRRVRARAKRIMYPSPLFRLSIA